MVYLNDGKGRFTPLSWTNGIFLDEDGKPLTAPPRDWGLTATFRDLNGSGAPGHLCVQRLLDARPALAQRWQGSFFKPPTAGVGAHTSQSSMGVDFADIDRDGRMDFFVLDMLARDWRSRNSQNV